MCFLAVVEGSELLCTFAFFSFLTLLSWDIGQEVEAHLSLDLAENTDNYLVNIYEIYKVVLQYLMQR